MNILFIRPPDPLSHINILSKVRALNIGYLSSYLKKNGFKTSFLDYDLIDFSEDSFLEEIIRIKPKVIAFSCMTQTIIKGAYLSELIKKKYPNIKTVVGGAHASGLPLKTLEEFNSFDFLVYGEGEETLKELCSHIENNNSSYNEINGLVYRKNDEVIQNKPRQLIKDIDSIPFPDRELINNNKLTSHFTRGIPNKYEAAHIFTSRGCPFHCTFCAICNTFGRSVRYRSVNNIDAEIKELATKFGINHIGIGDDTFTLKLDRAIAISESLRKNKIKTWNCDTRVNNTTPEMFKNFKKNGCIKISLGVESGSQRIIDLIKKKITLEQVEEAVYSAKEAGIKDIEGTFIIGCHPSETMEDINKTIKLINKLPFSLISCTVIVPYPGTPLYDEMNVQNLIDKDISWEDFVMFGKNPKWKTNNFTPEQLIKLQKDITRKFFMSPNFISKKLLSIRSIDDITYWFNAGLGYLSWYFTKK